MASAKPVVRNRNHIKVTRSLLDEGFTPTIRMGSHSAKD
jgi:hypothetical protein